MIKNMRWNEEFHNYIFLATLVKFPELLHPNPLLVHCQSKL